MITSNKDFGFLDIGSGLQSNDFTDSSCQFFLVEQMREAQGWGWGRGKAGGLKIGCLEFFPSWTMYGLQG